MKKYLAHLGAFAVSSFVIGVAIFAFVFGTLWVIGHANFWVNGAILFTCIVLVFGTLTYLLDN